jgi:hypothetical protein
MTDLKRKITSEPDVVTFMGGPMTSDELEQFVDAVCALLPDGVTRYAVYESSVYLGSTDLTKEELDTYAWRLAGNVNRLRQGVPITPWFRQMEAEWMPVQIVAQRLARNSSEKLGSHLWFRVLTGTAASMVVRRFWTKSFCFHLSKAMGFTSGYKKYPMKDMSDLVGMRLYGLFEPQLSANLPAFKDVQITAAFRTYNRDLIKRRANSIVLCNYGYTHPCNKCPSDLLPAWPLLCVSTRVMV